MEEKNKITVREGGWEDYWILRDGIGEEQHIHAMNRPDIFVIKVLGITVFDALVLTEQKVCRVTGGAFTGEAVADLLHLNIGYASVFKFDDDVGD